ncbi:Peptidyl-prolyl cis-trans isomerase FKBP65 [Striga hermonthica]|uniref:peptidylprolyl isomerase n=1 Tax=Striga hermonthica TaxID=68872 RepID=A0A9N7MLA1_STRHE|nr:Peptidyl-prolyl cis-trans isomerase FKBP65 [Striga hermonthica]
MVEFSKVNVKDFEDDDEEEEAGEEVESAPPLEVGQEREISSNGLKKMLIKCGLNWETPQFGDEVTIHYVASLLDGSKFLSTRDSNKPITLKVGHGDILHGLDRGIVTMTKGEISMFTLPPEIAYGAVGMKGVPPNSIVQFEVELLSWITVVDIFRDGGIVKRVLENGEQIGPPGDLDEVRVKYKAMLYDDTVVAKTPEEGVEFYVKDGNFCSALAKAVKTMKRGERVNLIVQPQYAFGKEGRKPIDDFPSIPPDSVVSIFLELLSFKSVVDITGDLKVTKKVLKEGEGNITANDGALVTIRYKAMLEDGTVFDRKGFDGEQPLQFITDEEQVIAGLDRAVSTMKKNEFALVTISPEYGYGSNDVKPPDLPMIQPSTTIIYEVQMLDFIREKAPWELSAPERIETAGRMKEEGNQLFKSGKYKRALKKYEKAVDYASQDGNFTDEDEKILKPLRVSCWLNCAACCLKQNNFVETISLCSKILDIESCNVKALYRRAQAYIGVSELISAEADIKKALEVDPQEREVKLLQKNLKQLEMESNKRDATLYKAMFSKRTSDENPVGAKRLKTA